MGMPVSTAAKSRSIDRSGGDPLVRKLILAILFLVVSILSVIIYALATGVVDQPAPRTKAESVLFTNAALVRERPKDGTAWADYAEALYATGDKAGAFSAIKEGRVKAKDSTNIRELNVAEVHLLILEGKNKEAVDKSTAYIQDDIDIRDEQATANFAKLIVVPYMMQDNDATIRMFVLRATAQGNLKQWTDAIQSLDNALQFNPEAADIVILRGYARMNSGDKAGARTDFETALKFLPNDQAATKGLKELESE